MDILALLQRQQEASREQRDSFWAQYERLIAPRALGAPLPSRGAAASGAGAVAVPRETLTGMIRDLEIVRNLSPGAMRAVTTKAARQLRDLAGLAPDERV